MSVSSPVHTAFRPCEAADREIYRVQSVVADDDYYRSLRAASTVLQLSENVENPLGELTPTLNYRLALTAGLAAHQPANPPSLKPSLQPPRNPSPPNTHTPPFPLQTWATCSPSPRPPHSFLLTVAIFRPKHARCVCAWYLLCGCGGGGGGDASAAKNSPHFMMGIFMWGTKTTEFSAETYLKCIFLAQCLFIATYVIIIFFWGGMYI